jgi:hypothetical protein
MKKLAALMAGLLFALAFAPPALAQEDGGTKYCSQVLQRVGEDQYPEGGVEDLYPCGEECEAAEQCQQSFAVAEMAAAAAAEASAAATQSTEGAVDGAAAYAAALDAARKTGVDEGTAETVATRAVASVATEGFTEPARLKASSAGPSAAGEPKPVAKPSGEREPVVESARDSKTAEREAAGEEPAGGTPRNEDAARDEDSARDGGSGRGEDAEVQGEKRADGKPDITVLPITDGGPPAGGGAFGVPFAPLAVGAPVLLALLVAAGLLVRRLAR